VRAGVSDAFAPHGLGTAADSRQSFEPSAIEDRGYAGSGDPCPHREPPQADIAARVTELLGPAPVSVDELARLADAPARQVRTVLMELELAGRIEWLGGDLVSSLPVSRPLSNDN
jgi:predicted Rossmann fold nucleotide-binding protein DprA/Smf involved in DNA uptake